MSDPIEISNTSGTAPRSTPTEPPVLPPVEPPTAGFLVQLFFVPMVIVTVIVLVWMAFSWLAQRGENPQELVADLERLDKGAWQRAYRLVEELRLPQNKDLRNDQMLAAKLSDILGRQMEEGALDEQRVWMRMFVARSLGHFDIDTGVPVLIEAAQSQVKPEEIGVRRAALQSLGVLAGKESVGPEQIRNHEGLFKALKSASEQFGNSSTLEETRASGLLRSTAAYVMGLVGGDESIEKLVEMLDDPYPDARYNAATGLARHGDERAVKRLLEMLAPNNNAAVEYEEDDGEHQWKQGLVLLNGLKATQMLVRQDSSVATSELKGSVTELLASDVAQPVKTGARETLQLMNR